MLPLILAKNYYENTEMVYNIVYELEIIEYDFTWHVFC